MWAPLLWFLYFILTDGAQHPTKKRKGDKFSFGSHVADCSPGEELKICRPACEPSCSNPEPDCFRVCSTATCVCMAGFVRMNGICIPKVACQMFARLIPPSNKAAKRKPVIPKKTTKAPPKTAKRAKLSRTASLPHTTTPKPTKPTPPPIVIVRPKKPPPQCGRGQQFTLCVCDSTCETEMICNSCSSGCGCFPHFVRGEDGACMPKSQCETKTIRIFEVPEYDDEPEPPPPTTTTHKPSPPAAHPPSDNPEEGPLPPTQHRRKAAGPPGIGLHRAGPPAITPFSFFRRKRIARRKAALKKLLAV